MTDVDVIEGKNPVLEALKAGRPISSILLDRNLRGQAIAEQVMRLASLHKIEVEYADTQTLGRHTATGRHQGVIAFACARKYLDLHDLLDISAAKNEPALYLVLDGIEDPQNLGAILRTADATGIHGVVIREHRAVGVTAAVARASAGAVEYVPVAMVSNIAQSIETLKKNGVWALGIDMAGEMDFRRVDFKLPTAIIIGAEGKGLSELVKKRCDMLASIPMRGKIQSLNASVAAAVVMYEALGQRTSR